MRASTRRLHHSSVAPPRKRPRRSWPSVSSRTSAISTVGGFDGEPRRESGDGHRTARLEPAAQDLRERVLGAFCGSGCDGAIAPRSPARSSRRDRRCAPGRAARRRSSRARRRAQRRRAALRDRARRTTRSTRRPAAARSACRARRAARRRRARPARPTRRPRRSPPDRGCRRRSRRRCGRAPQRDRARAALFERRVVEVRVRVRVEDLVAERRWFGRVDRDRRDRAALDASRSTSMSPSRSIASCRQLSIVSRTST